MEQKLNQEHNYVKDASKQHENDVRELDMLKLTKGQALDKVAILERKLQDATSQL